MALAHTSTVCHMRTVGVLYARCVAVCLSVEPTDDARDDAAMEEEDPPPSSLRENHERCEAARPTPVEVVIRLAHDELLERGSHPAATALSTAAARAR
eukprot:CAMPEP_0119405790 /NCGR_PEP_ID=MMETSP1335-20130426/360_1 /TAXON_ID=259385 /ORGANISM="Chrysoculter rhomboideus, Strain RCC1486" /LENGTH=97 /DNA_ID=CAMNT_0007429833 /DNA_START=221 /DNA_END=514 /DNA_ORIENTATION=+